MYCLQIFGIDKTTDNGPTFQLVTHGINQADIVSWVPPLVMDPNNSQILYFGTQYVYQSMDGANSWTPISFNMSPGGNGLSSISVSPVSSNTVYVAAEAENLCVTNNALAGTNATWTDIIDILGNRAITAVAADPHSASTAYVTFSGFNDIFPPGHAFMSSKQRG